MNDNIMETPPHLRLYDDFMSQTGPDRMQKILARYEIFKLSMEIPGDIVECGVFKGSGLYTWVKLMMLFKPNNEYRVHGFDFFEKSREFDFKYAQDRECLDEHEENWSTQDTLTKTCADWGFKRLNLVAGNMVDTTKTFVEQELGARVSILYIDVDNYEGALACLENLYPVVSPGGVIALDEYALPGYGESNAVDEFVKSHDARLRSMPWANTPSAYFIKGE